MFFLLIWMLLLLGLIWNDLLKKKNTYTYSNIQDRFFLSKKNHISKYSYDKVLRNKLLDINSIFYYKIFNIKKKTFCNLQLNGLALRESI